MAVDEQHSEDNPVLPDPHTRHPSFVEVICTSSGKTRRFALGTEANWAVALINHKLGDGSRAWLIEAVKKGEEPISFGPNSILVEYGDGWHLQTVSEPEGFRKRGAPLTPLTRTPPPILRKDFNVSPQATTLQQNISFPYMAKIFVAFVIIFAIGAVFTFALENLPRLILYINSL